MRAGGPAVDRVRALWERLGELADASDRWFVSLSQGFSMFGGPAVAAPSPSPRVSVLPEPELRLDGRNPASAGALPVARALGDLVRSHADTGYRHLAHDERFWSLVDLLRMTASPSLLDRNP